MRQLPYPAQCTWSSDCRRRAPTYNVVLRRVCDFFVFLAASDAENKQSTCRKNRFRSNKSQTLSEQGAKDLAWHYLRTRLGAWTLWRAKSHEETGTNSADAGLGILLFRAAR